MSIKKKILLVEDEALIAIATAETIRDFGYEVLWANSGEKALQLAKENENLHLILMDIHLGKGMDGVDTAKQILTFRHIPVIFLTSDSEAEFSEKVKKVNPYGYVIKDSGDFVLRSSIEKVFDFLS